MTYVVHKAKHIGRGHLLKFSNCQDAIMYGQSRIGEDDIIVGFICDGCSEGTASEVGANLGVNFLTRETLSLLKRQVPAHLVPGILYPKLVSFLRYQLSHYAFVEPADEVEFIKNHLLFTVVGFILTRTEAVVMITGDGTYVINDKTKLVESDDLPKYPAYHLIDRKFLTEASSLPESFEVELPDREMMGRLAIGSDAWHQELELLDKVWGFKHPAGLQRQLNQWSKTDKRFSDDVSIITLELMEKTEEDSDGCDD